MLVYPSGMHNNSQVDIPDYRNDDYYNVNYSKAEISAYLKRVKECIRAGRFIVLGNDDGTREGRQKNTDFMLQYGLYTPESQAAKLLSLEVEDFCHTVRSSDGESLYVFCAQWSLYKTGSGVCLVRVYIKHRCPEGDGVTDIVVSLHELEKPIDLIFAE